MRLFTFALLILCSAAPYAQTRNDGVTRWLARLADGYSLADEARTYRVVGSPKQITVLLTIANGSGRTLVLHYPTVREQARFELRRDREIPVVATWAPEAYQNAVKVFLPMDGDVHIAPGKGIEWTIVLDRADGEAFSPGRHTLVVGMAAVFQRGRTLEGAPWSSSAIPSMTLHVDVGPPLNARENSVDLRRRARAAVNLVETIRLLQLATKADPADGENLVALGNAYIRGKQYRDAIPILERAIQMTPQDRPTLYERLAYAYVGLGDEVAAERTLRIIGISESSIKDTLARYRSTISRQ